MTFNYYYKNEAEQFNFYRIPKILFTDKHFAKLSVEAKVLYGLLLDRMSLSLRNDWIDAEGKVYIYFKLEDAQECLGIGKDKCIKLFAELDKGIGLIERKKQGLGKPTMIYVKNFSISDAEVKNSVLLDKMSTSSNTPDKEESSNNATLEEIDLKTSENPKSESRVGENEENAKITEVKSSENPTSGVRHSAEVKTSEFPTSRLLKNRSLEVGKTDSNNTDINNTELSDINLSYQVNAELSKREIYKQALCDSIDYDVLVERYGSEKIDGMVEIMLDAMCSDQDFINLGMNKIPTMLITDLFLTLKSTHIEYVIECMEKNTSNIGNIKNYLLRALYNARNTMDFYYTNAVNRDFRRDD